MVDSKIEVTLETLRNIILGVKHDCSRVILKNEGTEEEINVLTIENVIIDKGDVYNIKDINVYIDVEFINCVFLSSINFSTCKFKSLKFSSNVKIENGLRIEKCNIGNLYLDDVLSEKDIEISRGYYQKIIINKCYKLTFKLMNCYVDILSWNEMRDCQVVISGELTVVGELKFQNILGNSRVNLNDIYVNHLKFSNDISNDSIINCSSSKIYSIGFINLLNEGKIQLTGVITLKHPIKYRWTSIEDYFKKAGIGEERAKRILSSINNNGLSEKDESIKLDLDEKIENNFMYHYYDEILYNDSIFEINDSHLGECKFRNCSYESVNVMQILNTELNTLKLFNTKLPLERLQYNDSHYEIFNDLYSAAKKQHNAEREVSYYRASQEALFVKISPKWISDIVLFDIGRIFKRRYGYQKVALKNYFNEIKNYNSLIYRRDSRFKLVINLFAFGNRRLNNRLKIIIKNTKDSLKLLVRSKFYLGRILKNSTWSKFKHSSTIISLLVSKVFSDFGTNWLRSIRMTVIVGLLFFILMMNSTKYEPCWSEECFSTFWDLRVDFVKFLNPTHKLTFMDVNGVDDFNDYQFSKKFGFVSFDLIGRIFIGIGIFETIRSFRKFTRK